MEIKKYDISNIKKEKRITFIITEFYMKLSVCNHVRNFLLIVFRELFKIFIDYIDRWDTLIVSYFEIYDNLFRNNLRRPF
jgi:hypothetical protein